MRIGVSKPLRITCLELIPRAYLRRHVKIRPWRGVMGEIRIDPTYSAIVAAFVQIGLGQVIYCLEITLN
jgi:hypothetical protein